MFCLRFVVRVASRTVAHIAVFSFVLAFDGAHGMAVKVHDRLSGANDASATVSYTHLTLPTKRIV